MLEDEAGGVGRVDRGQDAQGPLAMRTFEYIGGEHAAHQIGPRVVARGSGRGRGPSVARGLPCSEGFDCRRDRVGRGASPGREVGPAVTGLGAAGVRRVSGHDGRAPRGTLSHPDILVPHIVEVTVRSPRPGGGVSQALEVEVRAGPVDATDLHGKDRLATFPRRRAGENVLEDACPQTWAAPTTP